MGAPSERSGLGYTEDDSAGQSNIFATEPKVYQGKEISNSWVVALVGTIAAGGLVFVGVQKLWSLTRTLRPSPLGPGPPCPSTWPSSSRAAPAPVWLSPRPPRPRRPRERDGPKVPAPSRGEGSRRPGDALVAATDESIEQSERMSTGVVHRPHVLSCKTRVFIP